MKTDNEMGKRLVAAIPHLRAFAISLSSNRDRADDLVQETLVKAWANLDKFVEGTNLRGWLFTILRNTYYSEYRKLRHEVPDPNGVFADRLGTLPNQESRMDLLDFRAALERLPADQREALILIEASGLSYEDAAGICGVAVGTMKSRVNRARTKLGKWLSVSASHEFGAGAPMQAALPSPSTPHLAVAA